MKPHYEPGLYACDVISQAFSESTGGHPQIELQFYVSARIENRAGADGVIRPVEVPVSERYARRLWLVVTPDGMDYVWKKLQHAGFTGQRFQDLDLEGARLPCQCKHETRKDGNLGERWDLPLPPREVAELKHDPSIANKLNALFGKQLRDQPASAARPAPAPAAGGDDDIPF